MTEPNQDHPLPQQHELSETELAVFNALALEGVDVPDADRRLWRQQALDRTRIAEEEWIATNGTSEQRQETSTPTGLVPAVERDSALQQTPGEASDVIGGWDGTAPDLGDLGQAADHVAQLLELFSRVKPADDAKIEPVHKELIAKAWKSMMVITQRIQALELGTDGDGEGEKAPSLIINSACAVCYDVVANMVLIPCAHLGLCEVCVVLAVGEE